MNVVVKNSNEIYINDKRVSISEFEGVFNFFVEPSFVYLALELDNPDYKRLGNVIKCSEEGVVVWRNTPFASIIDDGEVTPFTNISSKDGKLIGHNWNGIDYFLDPDSGEVIGKPENQRPW